ncbi:CD82 antigen-like isoform X2 [Erpetoichthys calabaricus]|uniref:Tetraspanin n=2 Tax=Erpetoichthys calabaricus TaxID=27687 RepID=A0A8C4RNC8_ERPCA|nr:CD82 antigen-like isoform X2 [Erpetoichthys calabaricus]
MAQGCITATKYFLFLFNLIFFILGGLMLAFGLWILLDNQSFIVVLQESSSAMKVGSYILISVGSLSMLLGFLGCIGAVFEIKFLLGLYFTFLLLIMIAQVTAIVLIFCQRELLSGELTLIINRVITNYNGKNSTDAAWDYIQKQASCCGWYGPGNWTENLTIKNNTFLYPCSCANITGAPSSGFCNASSSVWPVYQTGCKSSLDDWFFNNIGVIIGICIAVAVVELMGMALSMCLCKSIQPEDYSKVSKSGH